MNAVAWRRRFRGIKIQAFGRHDLAKAGGSSRESRRKRNRPAWPGAQSEDYVYKKALIFLRGGSSRKLCGSFAEAMAKGGRRPVVATLY